MSVYSEHLIEIKGGFRMSHICHELHKVAHQLPRYDFTFEAKLIPQNGIYVLFEQGEYGHESDRIVRIGTHTGNNQLRSRLMQHFTKEFKDRSIFRKNIGRCILSKADDPYLSVWELDSTSSAGKKNNKHLVNTEYQKGIEKAVSEYMQSHFSFSVMEALNKEDRLYLESKIVSTVSLCNDCNPSSSWLGLSSPKHKIRESGLWQVNELYKEPLSDDDLRRLVGLT
jgi:hypothetical protein